VLLRDGKCCTNPLCRRRLGLQAHHIRFRSHGGRTVVWNETAVCEICHALAHAGLLSVRRLKSGQLLWSRKVDGLPGALDLAREMADASSLPEVRVDSPRGEPEAANHPRGESRAGGSPRGENPPRGESAGGGETDGESLEEKQRECDADVACALVKLGFAKAVARARVQRARGALGQRGVEATAEALLRESLLQTVG
jgi:hypothetical protein